MTGWNSPYARLDAPYRGSAPSRSPRIVLFGIYDLGVRALEALTTRNLDVVAVVTKPETEPIEQPIAKLARSLRKPVLTPESPGERDFGARMRDLRPDLIAVAGYHRILPPDLLALPPQGVVNLHGSLLPEFRGPCPWKWAIADGRSRSGATVHQMTSDVDRGDILAQCELDILQDDTGESLFLKISSMGSRLLAETILDLQQGTAKRTKQDERLASYQGNPSEDAVRIRWDADAPRIRNLIRGFSPRPGAWTRYNGARMRIRSAELSPDQGSGRPGMILSCSGNRYLVATGKGNLWVGNVAQEQASTTPRLMTLSCFE
jgi:methionyl-tRNA formyltransferase